MNTTVSREIFLRSDLCMTFDPVFKLRRQHYCKKHIEEAFHLTLKLSDQPTPTHVCIHGSLYSFPEHIDDIHATYIIEIKLS